MTIGKRSSISFNQPITPMETIISLIYHMPRKTQLIEMYQPQIADSDLSKAIKDQFTVEREVNNTLGLNLRKI